MQGKPCTGAAEAVGHVQDHEFFQQKRLSELRSRRLSSDSTLLRRTYYAIINSTNSLFFSYKYLQMRMLSFTSVSCVTD